MKTIPVPQTEHRKPAEDPHHPGAVERGKPAVRKLRKQGIIDKLGRRIRSGVPADMQEGTERDFGGWSRRK